MSSRKMLKSKGPKIDPCGTLVGTFPHSLKEFFIFQRCSLLRLSFERSEGRGERATKIEQV